VVGITPAIGADTAAFLSYAETKRASRHPERFPATCGAERWPCSANLPEIVLLVRYPVEALILDKPRCRLDQRFLTVPEAARYLRLNSRSVYVLAQRGGIPATRVTGKWLFPEALLREWVEGSARGKVGAGTAREELPVHVVREVRVAGSDDPALDLLADLLRVDAAAPLLFLARVGSVAGLRALAEGRADAACVHLVDPDSGEYNGDLAPLLDRRGAAVVNLFHRELGLVVAAGNPRHLAGLADVARAGLRFVNRQPGSGTRRFADLALARAGVAATDVAGYLDEVSTHWAVGLRVLRGEADAGLAARSVAHALGLAFVPLARERFDMVVPKEVFFRPAIQAVVEAVRSDGFRQGLERLGGYDDHQSGRILAEVS
jgi:excisionase family DNA binding protein